jgi:uncharacterized membrane protein
MNFLRKYRYAYLIILSMLLLQALLYRRFPDPMPIHWNAAGDIDGDLAKPWGVWLGTLVFALVIAVMTVLPALSTREFSMQPFAHIYRLVIGVFAGFALWITAVTDAIALGYSLPLGRHILIALGVLFFILGNWMGKITPNYYYGIRTPWTIADADVWRRTHRLAGPLLMLASLVSIAATFMQPQFGLMVFLAGIGLACIVPMVYSWRISNSAKCPPQDDGE